jgi:CBS domain containing-hemolysin-like protein
MAEYLTPIIVITILILINGFFVAAEFAIAAAPRTRVAQMAESGSKGAVHILEVLHSPELINRYLSTAQVGITIASLGLGMYGEHAVAGWLLGPLERFGFLGVAAAHTIATIVSVSLLTYLHVVLGEMAPKSMALQSAARAAVTLSPAMRVAEFIFRPLTAVLNAMGNGILRLAGMPMADEKAKLLSTDELAYIVEESSEGGLLDATEQLFLENALDFQERIVGQVMTPRTRMVAIPVDAGLEETLDVVVSRPHSRYPVYGENRDDVVGVIHAKDLARYVVQTGADMEEAASGFDLSALMHPTVFVPESLPLDAMLIRFRREHIQIAMVVDEYGGVAGVITLEDLAEELIGEIQDEFDRELPPVEVIDDHTLRVRGDLLLDELNQHYDLDLEEEDVDTVGGLVMARLGHVAQPGESVTVDGVGFEVETVEGLAVRTLIVHLPTKEK